MSNQEDKEIIDVDVLSEKTEQTLEERRKQIPLVEEIIQKYKVEFYEWLSFRKSTPAINSLKKSLEMISKIVSKFALHLKADNSRANQSIRVMKEVFNLEETTEE